MLVHNDSAVAGSFAHWVLQIRREFRFHLISVRNVYDYDGIIGGYVVVARTRPV